MAGEVTAPGEIFGAVTDAFRNFGAVTAPLAIDFAVTAPGAISPFLTTILLGAALAVPTTAITIAISPWTRSPRRRGRRHSNRTDDHSRRHPSALPQAGHPHRSLGGHPPPRGPHHHDRRPELLARVPPIGDFGGGVIECGAGRALWLPYVAVDRVDEATERARELGAEVLLAPRDGPAGWRSVITTPAGGEIALWQQKDWRL
jgi:hypothetical protein